MCARDARITICMAVNREPYLRAVLENIANRTSDKTGIMFALWYDNDPAAKYYQNEINGIPAFAGTNERQEGVGFSRHRAILMADGGIIVVTDPHVNVPQGWDDIIRGHFAGEEAQKDVVCAKTRCVSDFDSLMSDEWAAKYGGADFELFGDDGANYCSPVAKWAHHQPGEIPCVMGGFYAFTLDWYRQIGEPLLALHGWGCDEEMLSIGSWLCGGRVMLLDMTVSHLMRQSMPATTQYVVDSVMNRIRLPFLLPASEPLKEQMVNWVFNNPLTLSQDFMVRLAKDSERREVAYIKDLWLRRRDAWPLFAQRFLGVLDAGAKTQAPSAKQHVTRHILTTCPSCGKIDSLKGVRYMGKIRYCVCACGQHAKAEYDGNVLTITWLQKNRKKRRK